MRRSLYGLAVLTTMSFLPSCATYGHHMHGGGGGGAAELALRAFVAVAEIAIVASHEERREEAEEGYFVTPVQPAPPPPVCAPPPITYGPPATYTPPPVAAPRPSRGDAWRSFDPTMARAAVGEQNVSSCASRGVAHGWGHASVTFAPSGHVEKVLIDAPANLSKDAVACLGDRLGGAQVAPFSGLPVTVGTTWFMPE